MGIVWETYDKGVPLFRVPKNTLDPTAEKGAVSPRYENTCTPLISLIQLASQVHDLCQNTISPPPLMLQKLYQPMVSFKHPLFHEKMVELQLEDSKSWLMKNGWKTPPKIQSKQNAWNTLESTFLFKATITGLLVLQGVSSCWKRTKCNGLFSGWLFRVPDPTPTPNPGVLKKTPPRW